MIICKGIPYFQASTVTAVLGYADSRQAVRKNVFKDYVLNLTELRLEAGTPLGSTRPVRLKAVSDKSPLYINEAGIHQLIMKSKKIEAVRFQKWVFEEVLPQIRHTGSYTKHEQMHIVNERDLHYKVTQFTRRYFPEALLIAGLGELQDSSDKRLDSWNKGYTKGQPDLLILNRTQSHNGLAIELKTPSGYGNVSPEQAVFLESLAKQRYTTLISESYDEIIVQIMEYRADARRCMQHEKDLSDQLVRSTEQRKNVELSKTMSSTFDISDITVGAPVVSAKGAKTIPLSYNGNPITWLPDTQIVAYQPSAFQNEEATRVNLVMRASPSAIEALSALDEYMMWGFPRVSVSLAKC